MFQMWPLETFKLLRKTNDNFSAFRTATSSSSRSAESEKIIHKFPGRIPVILEIRHTEQHKLPPLDKAKFLVPEELTVGQFIFVIRRRIHLSHEKALFLFLNNHTLAPTAGSMGALYAEHKNKEDGFLYITVASEDAFGKENLS